MFRFRHVQGILYKLSSPDFRPVYHSPLEYCAIGSGASTTQEIARTADWLLAGQPGNDLVESIALRDAVSHFVAAESVGGVGGMYPCVKIDHRGVGCLGVNQTLPKGRFTLLYDASKDRWTQTNEATGSSIELLCPWEIDASRITIDSASMIGGTPMWTSIRYGGRGFSTCMTAMNDAQEQRLAGTCAGKEGRAARAVRRAQAKDPNRCPASLSQRGRSLPLCLRLIGVDGKDLARADRGAQGDAGEHPAEKPTGCSTERAPGAPGGGPSSSSTLARWGWKVSFRSGWDRAIDLGVIGTGSSSRIQMLLR